MAKISADFSGVNPNEALPEGDYELIVDEVSVEEGEKGQYLRWIYKVAEGEYEGRKLFDNTSLAKKALWRLRGVLVALGFSVPQGSMDVDLDDLPGSRCAASVIHEKYKGKNQARVGEFFPSRGAGGDEEGGSSNLDAMGLGELIEYAKAKSVDLTGCDLKKRAHIERAIQEAA